MFAPRLLLILSIFAGNTALGAGIETFQFVFANELDFAGGKNVLYFENVAQLQKSWVSFDRTVHTFYAGTETLIEPKLDHFTTESRFSFDTAAAIIGYKYRTYLPDWYNFNIRLRVPFYVPSDPFARRECPLEEENPPHRSRFEQLTPMDCGDRRTYHDRLQLIVEPLTVRKTWNLFTIYDTNRVTLLTGSIEYSNKLRFIDVTPDLEFPIALYLADEIRFRKDFATGARVRNDFIVGLASNFYDWLHLGVEFMYHLDTHKELNGAFIGEVYLELYFDIFFDNTGEAEDAPGRQVYEEEARG